jgi:predicted dehydrogenase
MTFGVTRRTVLGAATASQAGLGQLKVLGANDRIRIGCIGLGGMGTAHLRHLVERSEAENVQVVALCDVYRKRLNRAIGISKAEGYRDYRKLLERKDVDAVIVSTPDHWHAKISIDALEAGKHVYVEKPMTHTVEQAIELRNAVRRSGKVLQVGAQGTGSDLVWQARDAIKSGRIGKVIWAQGSYNRNNRVSSFDFGPDYHIDPGAGPDGTGENHIDWDLWLGHQFGLAPKILFEPRHFFRFRKYWPYSGGVATDMLYHKLAPLLLAIAGPNGEYPLRVNASGGLYVEKDDRDVPDTFLAAVDYPSEFSIFLISTLANDTQIPDRIYGRYGTLEMAASLALRGNGEFLPEFGARNNGYAEISSLPRKRRDQKGNFIDVIRGKGTLNCNVELGAATMVALKLAVDAYRQRKTMAWDARNEKAQLA